MAQSKPFARCADLSPLLVHVACAVAHHMRAQFTVYDGDHFAALIALARLARLSVPAHGVIASDDLRIEIDRVADRHLLRHVAEKEFVAAIERVKNREKREAIDSAHLKIVELSEFAHYYGGLASGLTLAELSRK